MSDDIAVIGYAGRFPGAGNVDDYWQLIAHGRLGRTDLSSADLDREAVPADVRRRPNFVPVGYVLDDADRFDAELFGISPGEARLLDPQHRVLLECAWQAFEHAGRRPDALGTVGVFAGTGFSGYLIDHVRPRISSYDTVAAYQAMLGNDKDFLATRVSYRLGLGGPSMTVQSACSSSLLAVHTACQSLLGGECDTALAGGVSVLLPQRGGYLYEPGMILSPDGYCRPFDADAAGTVPGRGVGVVLLKPLDAAIADGDTVHGVIRGSAVNNDGSAKLAYTAPNGDRQREVIATAQAIARARASDIGYVEAHGTGTQLGDPVEVAALAAVFREGGAGTGACALGSVKANIGHLDAAAGIAGLIKILLMLRHTTIPPQANFRAPNPALKLEDSPFRVPTAEQAWTPGAAGRLAAITSTGIGGTNVHVVIAEPPAPRPAPTAREREVLVLSARSPEELDQLAGQVADALTGQPELDLSDVAHTLQDGRQVFTHRKAVAAGSIEEAARLLREPTPAPRAGAGAASVVFAFPGQGSQYVGMGAWLHGAEPVFRDAVAACAAEFENHLNLDLRTVIYGDDAERLTGTMLAQAALFTTGYALARLWESWGVRPDAMIGHSIGEYVAATVAGVFTLPDAVRAVALRGRLMQDMPPGAMVAVALPEAELRGRLTGGVEIAAVNAADTVVVSGERSAVGALVDALRADGVRCRELATSHAFHSALMAPAAARLAEGLRDIPLHPPTIPFIANPDGIPITAEQAVDPDYWANQLRQPVRFHDGLGHLLRADGAVPVVLELGPPSGLAAAARRHPDRVAGQVVAGMLPRAEDSGLEPNTVTAAMASVWAAGVQLDWTTMRRGERRRRVALPGQPLRRTSHWLPAVRADAAPLASEDGKLADLADWFTTPAWRPKPAPALNSPPAVNPVSAVNTAPRTGTWLLLAPNDGTGARLADALAERLSGLGHQIRRDHPGADYPTLLAAPTGDDGPLHVVHLAATGDPEDQDGPGDPADPDAVSAAFADLLALARALAALPTGRRVRLRVVANGIWRVRPGERQVPGRAPIAGLLSVLPQEIEGLDAGVIDLGAEAGPDELTAELLSTIPSDTTLPGMTLPGTGADPAGDAMVCLRAHDRFVPWFRPLRLRDAAGEGVGLRAGGVYLITGGTGRLGLAIAEHLAATVSARLVLVGRGSPDPERVRAIERVGGEVLVVAADVAAEPELRRAVDAAIERFGAVHGVVHAAGLAGPAAVCLVPNLTEQTCAEHFRAKVTGTRTLAAVLRGVPLDFCLLMSSTAAVLGGPGLGAYAAANSYLNAFAESRPGWTSVLWDAWRTGEDGSIPQRALAMTTAEGVEALGRILDAAAGGSVVVSTTPIEPRLARWRSTSQAVAHQAQAQARAGSAPSAPAASAATSTGDRPQVPTTEDELQQVVAGVWCEALGVDAVGLDDNFFDLGGDSLIGLRVIGGLEARLGTRVPATALYEGTTVRRLAELLRGDQQPASFDEQARRARERKQALAATTRRRAEKGR